MKIQAFLLAGAILAAPTLALAQGADLTGFYYPSFGRVDVGEAMLSAIAPNTVHVDDAGALELPQGDWGGLDVKPEALAAAEAWQPEDDMTLSKACEVPGLIYTMQGPFPMKIHQGTEFVLIQLEYFDLLRVVYMDGRGHPPADAPHTKMGHSIGQWDGDTLVIDTTHLAPSTILNNGLNHGENLHVIERFRMSDDGAQLLGTQEFEDPDTLDNRGYRLLAWDYSPESEEYIYPYECDPSFGANYGAFDTEQ
jgi:hypothetical protein